MQAAAERLERDFGVAADVWSATSFGELRKDGVACDRWNLLHPAEAPRTPWVTQQLSSRQGPVVAASDFMRNYPDLVRNWVPGRFTVLGTDGSAARTRGGAARFLRDRRTLHHPGGDPEPGGRGTLPRTTPTA